MEIQRSPVMIAGKAQGYGKGTAATGARGFAFLSGAVGVDPDTGNIPEGIGEQTKIAMEAIKTRLEEYGTSLKNILHIWLYLKGQFPNAIVNDPGWKECAKTIEDFWQKHYPEFLRGNNPPANTLLGVTSLARPEFKVEIEVVAAIS